MNIVMTAPMKYNIGTLKYNENSTVMTDITPVKHYAKVKVK